MQMHKLCFDVLSIKLILFLIECKEEMFVSLDFGDVAYQHADYVYY